MKERKRLYPTVREDREREQLKRSLGLADTAIAKGGGLPQRRSPEEEPRREKPPRD